MTRTLPVLILTMVALALSGCARERRAAAEAGLPYRADLKAADDGTLLISVKAAGAGLAEVRESVRYPVTRHCLTETGNSTADWTLDPATGDWAWRVAGDELVFEARCRG
ncbi:hypothetical protein [Ruixingdingia sedimenti]|uniref:Lipoprotein n=1 Tax=Ruixingdingia sedimenti TaxID=3073604 RepID=A0ABU1F3U1_9RHOB|nr:hypothetical protein [Xinfangfangia sp. LG-4]MDR5651298.1 hypothetical protein [Xinfangfangia sp. LG-4]